MSLKPNKSANIENIAVCLKVVESWFQARCNGWWEHHFGVKLKTTDNQEWCASIQLYTTETEAKFILADLLERNTVSVRVENGSVRITSELLFVCLQACSLIIADIDQHFMDLGEGIDKDKYPLNRTINAGNPEAELKVIESWFQARCNGWWERHFGFELETTDNPGWLANFQLYPPGIEVDLTLTDSIGRNDVDVNTQNGCVRVYSESLSACLQACGSVIASADRHLGKSQKGVGENKCPSIRTIIGWIEDGENPKVCLNDKAEEIIDSEVLNMLCVLGFAGIVKILSDETTDFDLDTVISREQSTTVLILIRTIPIRQVDVPCFCSGFVVYEQQANEFVRLAPSSTSKFHRKGTVTIKSVNGEQGTIGIHYWLQTGFTMIERSTEVILHQ